MKNRKGVSPVVATVLLILIAVAASVIIWTWVSGAASQNPTNEAAFQERITIDGVAIDTDNNKTDVTVTNLGKVTVSINAAYILNGTTGTIVCGGTLSHAVSLDPSASATITVPNCNPRNLNAGEYYIAKVVTSNGVTATYGFTR